MLIKSLLESRLLAEDKGDGSGGGGGSSDDKSKKKVDPPGEDDESDGDAEGDEQDSKTKDAKKKTDDEEQSASDPGGWNEQQKAYIESLRKESGKYRKKAKELDSKVSTVTNRLSKFEKGLKSLFGGADDENVDPEEKIGQLSQALQAKELENSITELAYEHGIPKEDKEYFEFLMQKRLSSLGEDEELGEDDVAEIAKQAKAKRGASSSSVGTGSKPNAEGAGAGTVDLKTFKKMSITERSALYGKNPKLYESLLAEARETRQSL